MNPTRFIGLSACLFAALCCGLAWAECRKVRRSQLAAVLGLLETGLFLDMAFSVRWQLHNLLEGEAIRENLYAQRSLPQVAALGLLFAAAGIGTGLAFRYFRGRVGATMAVWGAVASLSCWCAEVISLHAVDQVFYRKVDGVMLVSLCWVLSSLMTGTGILWDARAAR